MPPKGGSGSRQTAYYVILRSSYSRDIHSYPIFRDAVTSAETILRSQQLITSSFSWTSPPIDSRGDVGGVGIVGANLIL